ncbi:MAG: sigma-70 family RNA polymerase sigma factor, partial [Clostridia bacterium]|nr:sigma-70 family RNA polymerase sigma factor [Clostridia bacterium]
AELTFEDPSDRSLFEAVMELPEMYRVTLHLYYYEEYSLREIAGILGITEGAVKSRLSRGRNTLKKKLSEDWEDE